jgi:hypothetical protein
MQLGKLCTKRFADKLLADWRGPADTLPNVTGAVPNVLSNLSRTHRPARSRAR